MPGAFADIFGIYLFWHGHICKILLQFPDGAFTLELCNGNSSKSNLLMKKR